jgi:hypothetical protein
MFLIKKRNRACHVLQKLWYKRQKKKRALKEASLSAELKEKARRILKERSEALHIIVQTIRDFGKSSVVVLRSFVR